jgi:hypothetical protein
LKTRHLEKSGVFILLKACPTGFLNGKTASPKFQFNKLITIVLLVNEDYLQEINNFQKETRQI